MYFSRCKNGVCRFPSCIYYILIWKEKWSVGPVPIIVSSTVFFVSTNPFSVTLVFVYLQHSALYLACINGHPKCVDLLIEWGAMVTYSFHSHDDVKSMNCLSAAIDEDHL